MLTKFQKRCMLLYERLRLDGRLPADKDHELILNEKGLKDVKEGHGFKRTNLYGWSRGRTANKNTLLLSNLVAKLYNIKDENGNIETADLLDEDIGIGVSDLGKELEFSPTDIRYIIDTQHGELLPTLSMFSIDKDNADEIARTWGGLYVLYRLDRVDGKYPYVTQIPISIRYLLKSNKANAKGMYRIRCKARVPKVNDQAGHYEYDGYMTQTTGAWFMVFEMREFSNAAKDMLLMTLNLPQVEENDDVYFRGDLLSRSVHVETTNHWSVILRRDRRYGVKKIRNKSGYYPIIKKTDPSEDQNHEGEFFDSYCKMIPMKEFKDNLVMQYMLNRHVP